MHNGSQLFETKLPVQSVSRYTVYAYTFIFISSNLRLQIYQIGGANLTFQWKKININYLLLLLISLVNRRFFNLDAEKKGLCLGSNFLLLLIVFEYIANTFKTFWDLNFITIQSVESFQNELADGSSNLNSRLNMSISRFNATNA